MIFKFNKVVIPLSNHWLEYLPVRLKSSEVNVKQISPETTYYCESEKCHRKLLKVALLGLPNAGKSTIINRLLSRTVCPTSMKIHTTKYNANAVFTEGNTQIVFIDTPGVLTVSAIKKYNAVKNNNIIKRALKQADLIGLIQDTTDIHHRSRVISDIKSLLEDNNISAPLILLFNKIDKLRQKDLLLEFTTTLTNKPDSLKFQDIFMISALTGCGIDDLRDYLIKAAKPQEWMYPENILTDQEPKVIIEQVVRAKLLDSLPQEIPYLLTIKLTNLEERPDGSISSLVDIICPTDQKMRYLLKNGGSKLRSIARLIEEDLRNFFQNSVTLRLNVKVSLKESTVQ